MATGTLAPVPYQTVLDANGNPVAGAQISTYVAGTTTPLATYADVTLATPNTNPIVADAAGRFVAYLSSGASYKFAFADASGSSIKTVDNISAVPASSVNLDVTATAGEPITAGEAVYLSDGSGGKTAGLWYGADSANPYSSTLPMIGLATTIIASGSSGTVRIGGQPTGLTSLVVGTRYYIGTAGALTTTAPANARLVGIADSTSSLILDTALLGTLAVADGAVGTPSLTFATDPDTGFYRESANTFAAVTNGAKAQEWTAQGFVNSPTQPRCFVTRSTDQTLADSTSTAITFDTERFDIGAMHDTGSNTSRLTVPTGGDGVYLIMAMVSFATNSTGLRSVALKKNGTTNTTSVQAAGASGSNPTNVPVMVIDALVATDYYETVAFQSSGGNLAVSSGANNGVQFMAVKLW